VSAFADYSRYYAAFYRDKDYGAEADYVLRSLQGYGFNGGTILELGCGQGGHAIPFAQRGCSVIGVDQSPGMIAAANRRREELPAGEASRLQFRVGDIRSCEVPAGVQAVVSLFHVVSYLPTDEDLRAAFSNVRSHVVAGTPFAFDFWFGSAVLRDPPTERRRDVDLDGCRVSRLAVPRINSDEHTVDVNYKFDVEPSDGSAPLSFEETHRMRYLFASDLESLCSATGFELSILSEWMQAPPSPPTSWNGFCVVRAR
jgi:SAM-dependent methyltransferase